MKYMLITGFKDIPSKNLYYVHGMKYINKDPKFQGHEAVFIWLPKSLKCIPEVNRDLYVEFAENGRIISAELA